MASRRRPRRSRFADREGSAPDQSAHVILHDDLVPQAILDLGRHAETVNVGKRCGAKNITQEEINDLMVEHARNGKRVVRLKSGDPLIFGRAAEELESLTDAGIDFEVVPGITAAFAAAAAIPCSLTDRNSASNVMFSTGHHAASHNDSQLPRIEDVTRVGLHAGPRFANLGGGVARGRASRGFPMRGGIARRAGRPGSVSHHAGRALARSSRRCAQHPAGRLGHSRCRRHSLGGRARKQMLPTA